MKDSPGAREKWKGRTQVVFGLTKMQWESMEKQLNSSRKISQDFHHCLFFKRSRKTWRKRTSSPKSSRTRSYLCQCSMTLIGKMMRNVVQMPRKSRITRSNFRKDIGHSWVQGRKISGLEVLLRIKKEKGFCSQQDDVAIQRNWSSCVQKFQCFESWNFETEER